MKKRINIVSLRMVKESSVLYEPRKITSPKDAFKLCKGFIGDSDCEEVLVITLDHKNQPTTVNVCSRGSVNMAIVEVREIFKTAILSNSSRIFVSHNHPSGDVTPSSEDCALTERIKKAGEIMGIELLDHLIIGGEKFYSFKENSRL